MIRVAAVVLAVVVGFAAWTAGVSAHAAYDHSLPEASGVIQSSPDTVQVWFQGPLVPEKPNKITVKGPNGKNVADGGVEIGGKDNMQATVHLQPDLPDGRYTVTWKVYALDGMRAEGSYRFYLNVQPTDQQLAEDGQLRAAEQSQITAADTTGGDGLSGTTIGLIAGIAAVAVAAIGGAGFWLWRFYSNA